MDYNLSSYPYPSRRRVIMARRGMVCTGQPLAAQAGLRMLLQGGNAVDAALATAICLTVVEPDCNGLGSDAFALVWIKDRLYGLNGSGPAPAGLDPGYRTRGCVCLGRAPPAVRPAAFCQTL